MAREASFDIVSQIDLQEVDNAYRQTVREIAQRYDLKDSGSAVELSKQSATITITAPADFVARQIVDVLTVKLVKRGIDPDAVRWDAAQAASGGAVRIVGHLIEGIDQPIAKRINKDIKAMKLKVRVTIEADQLRVFSASRDALQQVIQAVRDGEYGQPLQFVNYR